jgi:outer membrane protein OmpA-like peptidoglycan-associated protein
VLTAAQLVEQCQLFDGALEGVVFNSGSSFLSPESKTVLNDAIKVLVQNPTLQIAIHAHTDSRGSEMVNTQLSSQRAQSVLDYLVEQGIDAVRLETEGFGPSQPIADNGTAEGRAKNRRVELKALDNVCEEQSDQQAVAEQPEAA